MAQMKTDDEFRPMTAAETAAWRAKREEQREKYDPKARRYLSQPEIVPCWRGQFQEWHIDGASYREQLRCAFHNEWINPSGFTCELCQNGRWPEHELQLRVGREVLNETMRKSGKQAARNALVEAVRARYVRLAVAERLARELFPDEVKG